MSARARGQAPTRHFRSTIRWTASGRKPFPFGRQYCICVHGSSLGPGYARIRPAGRSLIDRKGGNGAGPWPDTAPIVTITAPADGATFTAGDSITFTATALDGPDGDISGNVDWHYGQTKFQEDAGSFSYSQLPGGAHTIKAEVTDSGGQQGSHFITITINQPPTVDITAPPDGSTFNQGYSIAFSGIATDPEDNTLTANLVWTSSKDEKQIGTGGSFSYSQLSGGQHIIKAGVTDSGGATGNETISLVINQAPTVTISQPIEGATLVQNQSFSFEASTLDDLDGTTLTSDVSWFFVTDNATGGPGGQVDYAPQALGAYQIRAEVTDKNGLTGQSVTRNVTVINTAPTVQITAPPPCG
ncbi:Ig-like domain-containing protein [Planctomycetota bacterium]